MSTILPKRYLNSALLLLVVVVVVVGPESPLLKGDVGVDGLDEVDGVGVGVRVVVVNAF
jgi:hypothetical protein